MHSFPTIRALHFREYSNGYYRLPSYAAASLISGCLLCSLYQLVQGLIVYAMVGLQWEAAKVSIFVLIVLLSACIVRTTSSLRQIACHAAVKDQREGVPPYGHNSSPMGSRMVLDVCRARRWAF